MTLWNPNVLLLALSQALMLSGMSMILTTAPLTGSILSARGWLSTLPIATLFIAMAFTSIPAAWLMAYSGRKSGFILSSVFAIVGAAVATTAMISGKFWLFVLGTTFIGIYTGFGNYFRFAVMEVVENKNRNNAVSLVLTGGVLSALIGPNLAGWTRNLIPSAPFAGSYAALIVLYCVAFAAVVFIKFPSVSALKVGAANRRMPSYGSLVSRPEFAVAVVCGMLGYGVMNLLMTATPLAMHHHAYSFSDTAFVIQWHLLGMFLPSFFTGYLITRFGMLRILTIGVVFGFGCVGINLAGSSLWHYWVALLLLGVSWNFLYIGATIMLTESFSAGEQYEVQAFNDFSVFAIVAIAALSSGPLQTQFGWQAINLGVLPLLTIILASIVWLKIRRQGMSLLETDKCYYVERPGKGYE
jgi:MFS family permease